MCGISTGISKSVSIKMKKCHKKHGEVKNKLRQTNLLYSRAVDDSEIIASEYEEIVNFL